MLTFGGTLFVLLLALLHVRCDNHQYQAIIDSGSTGSRVYIYRYNVDAPLQTIEELHSKRVDPALATFYKNRAGLHTYLNELVSFVEEKVDRSFHSKTSMSLKATAGLRTIPAHERDWIMTEVHHVLRNSSFVFNPVETRVLTGGEEALFGLLAINIAFSNLTNKLELSMGAGDLGGSSQQVAFVVPPKTFLQSFIDSYLQPFGMWPSSASTSSVAKQGVQASQSTSSSATNDGSGNSSSSGPSKDESHASEDITDECLPNFAVTFPTPSNSLMSTLFAPFAALATTYSPAALLAGTGWLPSDLTRNTLSKSQVSSPLAQHPALQSAFLSKPYDSSVTINIYAKSMAGMGLVAAMNETFYFIAQNHQRRIQRRSALILAQSTMSSSSDNQSSTTLRSPHRRAYDWSDAHICHSSLDLSDANTRYCHEKWEQSVSTNNDTMLSSGEHQQQHQHLHHHVVEDIEITENNDGDHLYGEHASWLHALQSTDEIVDNPCAPPGENLPYPDALSTLRWQGTGDFETCVRYTRHLVKVHALRDRKCLSQWQPQLPSSFIMMDNYPKVLQVLQLPIDQLSSSLTPAMIHLRGREICQLPWTVLQEVYPHYPAYRVQQVCFAASFLYVLMTDVYDMAEGDETLALASLPVPTWRTQLEPATLPSSTPTATATTATATANPVANISALTSSHAFLTPPTGASSMRFVAMDSHDSFTIGWSLGAAIISAMNITYTEELDASAMQLVTRPSSFVATVAEGDGSAGAPLCDLVADTYVTDAASLSRLPSETDGAAALVVVDGDVDRLGDGSEASTDTSSSSNVCPVNNNDGAAVPADDGAF